MPASPTQLSLRLLRANGFEADVAERWNHFAKVRQDLFGCFDIICFHPGGIIAGVQCTTAPNLAARRTKILQSALAYKWLKAGGRIILHGWRKPKNRWLANVEELTADRFPGQSR